MAPFPTIGAEPEEGRRIAGVSSAAPDRAMLPVHAADWRPQDIGRESALKLSVILFAVCFLAIAVRPEARIIYREVPGSGEAVRVARSLAFQGSFANPFVSGRTGTTAHVAPVYPFLYAGVLRLLGTGYPALLVLWAANIGWIALQMALLPWITRRWGMGFSPGVAAAALGCISLAAPVDTRWECFLTGALLTVAYLLTTEPAGALQSALAGILWGILILTNPVTVVLLPAWAGVCIAQGQRERSRLARRFALMAAVAAIAVAPWILRDRARFGAWMFVRDNLGLELSAGNNPCAKPTLQENLDSGCDAAYHPDAGPAVAAQLLAMGEYHFNQRRLRQAFAYIEAHPRRFAGLSVSRMRQFWFPTLEDRWEMAAVWMVTLLSLAGVGMLARRSKLGFWTVLVSWLVFPAIYYFVAAEPRYRYPIYWTSLAAAALPLAGFAERVRVRLETGMRRK